MLAQARKVSGSVTRKISHSLLANGAYLQYNSIKPTNTMRTLAILILIALIAALTFNSWMPQVGEFLLVKDRLQKADCIVLLAGDTFFRFKKAVELYDAGYAGMIVHSVIPESGKSSKEYYNFERRLRGLSDMTEKDLAMRAFRYFGKGAKDVYITQEEVTSTFDEAVAAKRFMSERRLKSMILVTSTYHMRRAFMIFKTVFRGSGIEIYNCTAVNTLFDPPRWWQKEKDVRMVMSEYCSLVFNIFYHFVFGRGRTAFDSG